MKLPRRAGGRSAPHVPSRTTAICPVTAARASLTTKSMFGIPISVVMMDTGTPSNRPAVGWLVGCGGLSVYTGCQQPRKGRGRQGARGQGWHQPNRKSGEHVNEQQVWHPAIAAAASAASIAANKTTAAMAFCRRPYWPTAVLSDTVLPCPSCTHPSFPPASLPAAHHTCDCEEAPARQVLELVPLRALQVVSNQQRPVHAANRQDAVGDFATLSLHMRQTRQTRAQCARPGKRTCRQRAQVFEVSRRCMHVALV